MCKLHRNTGFFWSVYFTKYVSCHVSAQCSVQARELEAYSESCQTSKMECFAKIVNGYKLLTVFAKHSISDA